jgi:UPF0042 nucleotide-binding protein
VSEFLVVAGMSGAGRSSAAAVLEDLGWLVIDNLPAELIPTVAELAQRAEDKKRNIALVMGRGGEESLKELERSISLLKTLSDSVRVMFLDSPDEVLIRRYEGTRRKHPIYAPTVDQAIAKERELLRNIRASADIVIDTGEISVNDLKKKISELISEKNGEHPIVSLVSFGFAHGIPLDVDMVFDVRFLPNPYWVPELRGFTGLDKAVSDFVLQDPQTKEFLDKLLDFLDVVIPGFIQEGKAYITLGIGCTGGRHRSVAIANKLGETLKNKGLDTVVIHRDIDK